MLKFLSTIRPIRWLMKLCADLLRLLISPPPEKKPKAIDLDAKCPSCGHGPVSVETVVITARPNQQSSVRKAMLLHQCAVCKGVTFTKPLCGDDANVLWGREMGGM